MNILIAKARKYIHFLSFLKKYKKLFKNPVKTLYFFSEIKYNRLTSVE